MRLIPFRELRAKGIPWSLPHIARLEESGQFTRRVRLGKCTHRWVEEEVDRFMADRLARHETEAP